MCGIIGYTGKEPAAPILYGALTRLEYRGYDSAGIATIDDNKIHVVKEKGKLGDIAPQANSLGILINIEFEFREVGAGVQYAELKCLN